MASREDERAEYESLVEAARRGDEAAWNRLVARHRAELLGLARQRLRAAGGAVDASDVVQDALWKASRKHGQMRASTEEQLLAWLKTVVRNQASDELRRWLREKRGGGRDRPLPENSSGEAVVPAGDTSPSARAAHREEEEEYQARLARLSAGEREIIRLRVTEGLDWAEVARLLGMTEAAVKQKYFRALRRLRQMGAGNEP